MSKRRAESVYDRGSYSRNDGFADLGSVTSPKKRQQTRSAASNSPLEPVAHYSGNESCSYPGNGEVLDCSDGGCANLYMGDNNDQACLASIMEKEREELLIRNERKEVISTRFEIRFPTKQQENSSSIRDLDDDDSGTKAEKPHQYDSSSPVYSVLPTGTELTLIEHSSQNSSDSESGDLVIDLKEKDSTSVSAVEMKVNTQKSIKPRGRPTRGKLSILDRRLMELLAPYRVIHQGRKHVTFHPGDVRRLSIITAATILLVPITDLTLPEDISELPKLYGETAKMAIELSRNGHNSGLVIDPFPPNIVLLTG